MLPCRNEYTLIPQSIIIVSNTEVEDCFLGLVATKARTLFLSALYFNVTNLKFFPGFLIKRHKVMLF